MRRIGLVLLGLVHVPALFACGHDEVARPAAAPVATAVVILADEPPPRPRRKPSLADLQEQALTTALAALEKELAERFDTFTDLKVGYSRVWRKDETVVAEWVMNAMSDAPLGHYGLSIMTFDAQGNVTREQRYTARGLGTAPRSKQPQPVPPIPAAPEITLSTGAPPEERNVEIAQSLFSAMVSKKQADFLALLTDDVESEGLVPREPTRGKSRAKALFETFTTAFPDARFEVAKVHGIGDHVIVESTLETTRRGPAAKATARPVAIPRAAVIELRGGKVARLRTFQPELEQPLAGAPAAKPPGSQ